MLVSQGIKQFQIVEPVSKHPEKDLPLTYRPLSKDDVFTMYLAFKRNASHISSHFWWAEGIEAIGIQSTDSVVQRFLNETEKDHYLFFLGEKFVGQGTLGPIGGVPEHRQIALWVDEKWINKGLGTRISATLENIAFEQHGYHVLFYTHDQSNLASERIAIKLGFEPHCKFESDKLARLDSGTWKCWAKDNPIFTS